MADNMSPKDYQELTSFALGMYAGEPCRVCGVTIGVDDFPGLVFAGYSMCNKARSAHGTCWARGSPKSEWAYPDDDPSAPTGP